MDTRGVHQRYCFPWKGHPIFINICMYVCMYVYVYVYVCVRVCVDCTGPDGRPDD